MSDNTETAILAGGCSWIMQQLLRYPDGVISTRVGWTGGEGDNPTEENPQGHAEAVEVVFDPERLSYRDVLEYFFQVHRADLGQRPASLARSQPKGAQTGRESTPLTGPWPPAKTPQTSQTQA